MRIWLIAAALAALAACTVAAPYSDNMRASGSHRGGVGAAISQP